MRVKKLSARCEAIAGFVGAGERIADIGSDHAYVPLYLVREGISPSAILTDIKPGPLEKTRANVEKAVEHSGDGSICVRERTQIEPSPLCSVSERTQIEPSPLCSISERTQIEPSPLCSSPLCSVELRLGDGLSALESGEVDTVIIAGMGGETIISILEADPGKAAGFRKYILQPRTKTELLEGWLQNAGWKVTAKTAAEEKGRICDIIVCAPKEGEL